MTGFGASSIAYPRFGGELEWHTVIWWHFGQRISLFELSRGENPDLSYLGYRDFQAINLLLLVAFYQVFPPGSE